MKAFPLQQLRFYSKHLSMEKTFSALKHRNYRLWFIGQLISMLGTWMQTTAQGYLIYQLTKSPAYLGQVGFAAGVPSWFFMLYAGVIADRLPRRKLIIITQVVMLILAIILAVLTFKNIIEPWHILVLAFLGGIANAFDAPARQSFVSEMVSREDMCNAIALNSTLFNLATTVGPAASGLIYALVGPAWCFTINAFSFIAVIIALLAMNIQQRPIVVKKRSALADLKEGLSYALHHETIRSLIMVAAATSLFGLFLVTLLPAWAVGVMHGDATTNGLLQSARGLGAFSGALMIASLPATIARGKILSMGQFVFPILLFIFAFTRWLPISLFLLVGIGWGMIILYNVVNALVQSLVPDELRGRVMSIYILTFFGCMPLGHLMAGQLAQAIGAPQTLMISAALCLLFAIVTWLRVPSLRQLR